MARKSRNERLRITARVIHGYYQTASDARANREDVLDDAYRRTDPSYVPDGVGHPKVKSPYLFSVLNTKKSWLIRALKANGLWVLARPMAPEYGDAADIVTKVLNAQFTNRPLGNERTILSGLGQGFEYGDHYWLLRWKEDGAGHWGVEWVNLNIMDVFPDPWANRYYILRRFITLAELHHMAMQHSEIVTEMQRNPETGQMEEVAVLDEKGKPIYRDGGVAIRAYRKIERAVKAGKIFGRWGWNDGKHSNSLRSDYGRVSGSDDIAGGDNVDGKDDPANVRITMLEYHETANDGIVAKVIPDNPNRTDEDSEDLFFQEPEPQPYGKCQVQRWSPYPVDDECFGRALGEIVGGLADLHDYALRASARRVQRYADPAVLHKRRSKISPIYLRSQSNVAIPVEDPSDILYMDPPAGGDMHHLLHLITKQSMDMGTGESEQRRGQVGGAGSATEAAIAEQAGSTSDFLVATHCFMAIEECADLALRILRKHVTEDKLIPFLGARTAEMVRLTPDVLDHQYWICIGGSVLGGNPQARAAGLDSIAQFYGSSGELDLRETLRARLDEGGWNAEKFLLRKDGPPSIPPQLEHKMLFDHKQDITVSAEDDHLAHVQAHHAELQARRLDPVTDPEDLRRLYAHMIEHRNAYMMQMQVQMAGAASSGGGNGTPMARPLQPHQAGQPGQPATFTPRTSQVNQQRQAPNMGQAPQPAIAPNRVGVLTGGQR